MNTRNIHDAGPCTLPEAILDSIGEIRDDWIADAMEAPPIRRRFPARRFGVLAAAILLSLVLAVSALAAADADGVYDFLYALSPTIAQKLKPVRMCCADNGIELEVISANVEGDTAQVYLGLRDLEGERVTPDCDLFDSYSLNLPSGAVGTCCYSHFDEATKTACFLVEISRDDGKPIRGQKLTFSLREFLSGKRERSGRLDLNPDDVQANPAVQAEVTIRGYSWNDESHQDFDPGFFLVPRKILSPMDGVSITGMGWVDGFLHIQSHYAGISETDAHGYVFLTDASGAQMDSFYEVSFWDADFSGSYEEQIFDISPEELAGCAFHGWFTAFDSITQGNWEITFPIE